MSSFASDIQLVCLGSLSLLIVYTLWLSRYRGLDGHLTVRWLLIQGGALLTVMFWRWLPVFSITSSMQERALLLMVTVLMFTFVVVLMLDLLVRSSRQSAQIKRLTQELGVQRARVDKLAPDPLMEGMQDAELALPPFKGKQTSGAEKLIGLWIILCIGFSIFETFGYNWSIYPTALKRLLTAAYLE